MIPEGNCTVLYCISSYCLVVVLIDWLIAPPSLPPPSSVLYWSAAVLLTMNFTGKISAAAASRDTCCCCPHNILKYFNECMNDGSSEHKPGSGPPIYLQDLRTRFKKLDSSLKRLGSKEPKSKLPIRHHYWQVNSLCVNKNYESGLKLRLRFKLKLI